MKIGLLAYSTNTGLGYQTLEFYENFKSQNSFDSSELKVLISDLSEFNGMETHHERYYQPRICKGLPEKSDCEWLCDGVDLVFVCETPLNYYLFEYASKSGVKTIQQYNYEFLDFFRRPELPKPSVLASPSMWGIEKVKKRNFAPVEYWPVPVNTKNIPFRKIESVETFVHILGRPTANDRNGTIPFLEAAKILGKKYKYRIYLQPPAEPRAISHFEPVRKALNEAKEILGENLEIIENCESNIEMYSQGDVLVLPRKYGGLCLPMWEALAAGMPVIMTNISPNPTNLPIHWLVESRLSGRFQAHTEILLYDAIIENLVGTMRMMTYHIKIANKQAKSIADKMSWEVQKPLYEERFKRICE